MRQVNTDLSDGDCGVKVLLVDVSDWSVYNSRLTLGHTLREEGAEVVVVCPEGPFTPSIQKAGFRVIPWKLSRRSVNPLTELSAFRHLWQIYGTESPDVVQHFSIKPDLYGPIAARLAGVPHIVNTWTGLGFVFSDTSGKTPVRRPIQWIMKWAYSPRVWHVFQNHGDRKTLERRGVIRHDRWKIIPGSGVNTDRFFPLEKQHADVPVILMATRLLRDKGVAEFVEAARILKEKGVKAKFRLAGEPDPKNRATLSEGELEKWHRECVLEFLGRRNDMPDLLRQADVAVLPSYHEGMPRFLLEGAATGLPLVTADNSGGRAVVQDGENGFVVPVKDSEALATAIGNLIADPDLRDRMGRVSRTRATETFDHRRIADQFRELYQDIGAFGLNHEHRSAGSKS